MKKPYFSARMRERKRMAFALQLKSLSEEGRFAGYASVFDVVDNQRDIVMKGAFARTLARKNPDIKLLWQHQQDEPIGVFERLFEDEVGLYVEGKLLLDVARAREAFALLKAGAVSGLSIGYTPVRYRIDADTGVRMLAEVDLFEVSLVTFPANSASKVTVVKSSLPHRGRAGVGASRHCKDYSAQVSPHPNPLPKGEGELDALAAALERALGALKK